MPKSTDLTPDEPIDPNVATLIAEVFDAWSPPRTPTKQLGNSDECPETMPQFEGTLEWQQCVSDHSKPANSAISNPRNIIKDVISSVLEGIDCATVKDDGFAHLFNNIFTPPENFCWFKSHELKKRSWLTLKCPQVCFYLLSPNIIINSHLFRDLCTKQLLKTAIFGSFSLLSRK